MSNDGAPIHLRVKWTGPGNSPGPILHAIMGRGSGHPADDDRDFGFLADLFHGHLAHDAADTVIHYDPWWNPAVEDQATDRAHRIGQERSVTVYRLVAKDTIEEQILALHEEKRELISGVLDGADRAGKMSSEDLINLIRVGLLS